MEKLQLKDIAVQFSKHILAICRELDSLHLQVISKQLIRSGTAIGALVFEASEAESADDFIHKMKIASKEARETQYWLDIVKDKMKCDPVLIDELTSMQKIITKSIQTAKTNRDLKNKKKG